LKKTYIGRIPVKLWYWAPEFIVCTARSVREKEDPSQLPDMGKEAWWLSIKVLQDFIAPAV
jgi:hypothetical protein